MLLIMVLIDDDICFNIGFDRRWLIFRGADYGFDSGFDEF